MSPHTDEEIAAAAARLEQRLDNLDPDGIKVRDITELRAIAEAADAARRAEAATRAGSGCLMEPVHKKPPVGQASERVVERQILDFFLCRLAFRKVDVYPDIMRDDAVISFNGGNGEPCGIYFAVFASIPDFSLPCSGALDGLPYRAI